jgi:hypothetical protein
MKKKRLPEKFNAAIRRPSYPSRKIRNTRVILSLSLSLSLSEDHHSTNIIFLTNECSKNQKRYTFRAIRLASWNTADTFCDESQIPKREKERGRIDLLFRFQELYLGNDQRASAMGLIHACFYGDFSACAGWSWTTMTTMTRRDDISR